MKAIERSRLALPVAGLQICTSKGEMYVRARLGDSPWCSTIKLCCGAVFWIPTHFRSIMRVTDGSMADQSPSAQPEGFDQPSSPTVPGMIVLRTATLTNIKFY